MMVQCIKVPKTEGETVRQAILDKGLLLTDYAIQRDDAHLYFPVTHIVIKIPYLNLSITNSLPGTL